MGGTSNDVMRQKVPAGAPTSHRGCNLAVQAVDNHTSNASFKTGCNYFSVQATGNFAIWQSYVLFFCTRIIACPYPVYPLPWQWVAHPPWMGKKRRKTDSVIVSLIWYVVGTMALDNFIIIFFWILTLQTHGVSQTYGVLSYFALWVGLASEREW